MITKLQRKKWRESSAKWRALNPERWKAVHQSFKKRHSERLKPLNKAYQRTSYLNSRTVRISYAKKWYWENRDLVRRQQREHRLKFPEKMLWFAARNRARLLKLPFTISVSDIVIPHRCPALGLKLYHGSLKMRDNSPSADRIIPAIGYVPGNIVVMSCRANRIKFNASLAELKMIIAFLEDQL